MNLADLTPEMADTIRNSPETLVGTPEALAALEVAGLAYRYGKTANRDGNTHGYTADGLLMRDLLSEADADARFEAQLTAEQRVILSASGTARDIAWPGFDDDAMNELEAMGLLRPYTGSFGYTHELTEAALKLQERLQVAAETERKAAEARRIVEQHAAWEAGMREDAVITDATLDEWGAGSSLGDHNAVEPLRMLSPKLRHLAVREARVLNNTTPGQIWSGAVWQAVQNIKAGKLTGLPLNEALMAYDPDGTKAAAAAASGRGWEGFRADAEAQAAEGVQEAVSAPVEATVPQTPQEAAEALLLARGELRFAVKEMGLGAVLAEADDEAQADIALAAFEAEGWATARLAPRTVWAQRQQEAEALKDAEEARSAVVECEVLDVEDGEYQAAYGRLVVVAGGCARVLYGGRALFDGPVPAGVNDLDGLVRWASALEGPRPSVKGWVAGLPSGEPVNLYAQEGDTAAQASFRRDMARLATVSGELNVMGELQALARRYQAMGGFEGAPLEFEALLALAWQEQRVSRFPVIAARLLELWNAPQD